jgi:16S rRNA (guanine527-N7)-methyltransferase
MESVLEARLSRALQVLGIALGDGAPLGLLVKHWMLVFQANVKINLVSRKSDFIDGVVLHVADSLAALKLGLPETSGTRVLDFGSGAGFPGIPLKIAVPGWEMCLAESRSAKACFLSEAIGVLGLDGVNVFPHNIGPGGKSPAGGPGEFDIAVARAVDSVKGIVRRVSPLLVSGGMLVVYKGPGYREEMVESYNSVVREGMELARAVEFSLPLEGSTGRALLLFSKKGRG